MKRIRMNIRISIIFLLFSHLAAYSQNYIPGKSYFGRNNYIEYIAGNLPIIISVPHGGDITPSEIPDRTCGDETVTDLYTINLAKEIRDAINLVTGCYPHIIINNLKRTKLDANRDLQEAACGNAFAETAWHEFQNFIDSAAANVTRKSGKGLYIDLHGHGHTIQRLELGYLLTAIQLSYPDATLNTTTYKNYNSIRNLINTNVTNLTHSDLLHGTFSLGSMFAAKGFPSVPSTDDMFPLNGQSYFTGGYNTLTHGSKNDGTIDGIQIECNQNVRLIESSRKDFATNFAVILLDYLKKHYFPNLPDTYCNRVPVEKTWVQKLVLFPNPFENVLYIMNSTPSDLFVYDSQGKLIISKRIETEGRIDLGWLTNGIYIVKIIRNGYILYSGKIIKESCR
jgi:hypothetical protein